MRINRRTFTRGLIAFGTATAGKATAQAKSVEVSMDIHNMFEPASVTVAVGDTVQWINNGVLVHTVTFDPAQAIKAADVALPSGVAPFASEDLNQDDTYSHKFTAKGTYKYVCKYHEEMGMMGTVIVA